MMQRAKTCCSFWDFGKVQLNATWPTICRMFRSVCLAPLEGWGDEGRRPPGFTILQFHVLYAFLMLVVLFPCRQMGWVTDAYLQDNRSEAMLALVPKCCDFDKMTKTSMSQPVSNATASIMIAIKGQNGTGSFFKHLMRQRQIGA